VGVGHRLLSGEGLGGDEEQRRLGAQGLEGLDEVGGVDVGDEVDPQVGAGVGLERLGGHGRPEVGPADADVDRVGDALAGVALPGPAADRVAEAAHGGQDGVDLRHDVPAVDEDGPVGAVAQGDVQDRPALGGVDLLAGEHLLDPAGQVGLPG
jgi:hypothetical protein